ncbi:MAG: hypothetical protein WA354_08750 [Terracidiphilus sp.]
MDAVYGAVAALAMGSPFLAIVLILAYSYLSRVPWGGKRNPRRRPFSSSAGIGTVVLGLTLIYRPRILYAVEAQHRQVEDADEDDNGDPDSPKKHLIRQLRRIRRGEKVDVLSLRLR